MVPVPTGFHFRLDTSAGRFYAYVEAEVADQGEVLLRAFIRNAAHQSGVNITILAVRELKRTPSDSDITILLGPPIHFLSGKAFWKALGRGQEYQQLLAQAEKEYEPMWRKDATDTGQSEKS